MKADEALTREHLRARVAEPASTSEGRWEIFLAQRGAFEPIAEGEPQAIVLDSAELLASNIAQVLAELG
jgi:hypothetical protein